MKINNIYIDLEGVLADFLSQAESYNMVNSKGLVDWNSIRVAGASFWPTMPWTKNGKALFDIIVHFCIENNINLCILAIANDDSMKSGKTDWIKTNLHMNLLNVHFVKTGFDKSRFANASSVLIDDFYKNVAYFRARQGYAILYKNNPDDIIVQLNNLNAGIIPEKYIDEAIHNKKVIRDGKKEVKKVTDRKGYRVEYDKVTNLPKEVKITTKEKLARKHGQKSGRMKRYGQINVMQKRRARSFKIRSMQGLEHYSDNKGKIILPKLKED